jgi:hypothetical protein
MEIPGMFVEKFEALAARYEAVITPISVDTSGDAVTFSEDFRGQTGMAIYNSNPFGILYIGLDNNPTSAIHAAVLYPMESAFVDCSPAVVVWLACDPATASSLTVQVQRYAR